MDLPDPPKSREDVDQEAFARAAKRQEATEQKQRRSGVISVAFVILVVVGLFYWYGGNADKPVPGASSPPAVSIVDEQTVADQTRDQVAAIITTEDPSTGVVHVNTVVSQMEAGTGCTVVYGVQFQDTKKVGPDLQQTIDSAKDSVLEQGGSYSLGVYPMSKNSRQHGAPPFVVIESAALCP